MPDLQQSSRRYGPALLGGAWVLVLMAPLLAPARALANRDILLFHLPLRTCLRNLLASGSLPVWNPWLNGGQPILSNPSYAAFYPPTWLTLPLRPVDALSVLAVLHLALAFAGAWRLARHLGTGSSAAALAAVGYAGCGGLLSLLHSYTLFCSMAWFPWVLAFGDEALRRPAGVAWRRPAVWCGLGLGMQLLNGEPSTVLVSGLALLALATSAALSGSASWTARLRRAARAAVPLLLGAGLAAVQLVPTAGRLAGGQRSRGLTTDLASLWSARPARLVELVFPHAFGEPTLVNERLYFGHGVHDFDYPYVVSLYPGLLMALLAVASLGVGPLPRRAAWLLCLSGGAFLALGRHNPLYEPLRHVVPLLAMQRFPERFIILALAPLTFVAALGWHRLLAARQAGRRAAADLPLALGLVVFATAAVLAALLYAAPGVAATFIREHSLVPAGEAALAHGLAYLRVEAWAAVATSAATTALLALCRWRRPSGALLSVLAVTLLAVDLWHYDHTLIRTVPAEEYARPPAALRRLMAPNSRVFVESVPEERELPLAGGDYDIALTRALLERVSPYSPALWQVPMALHEDYDLMLTPAGRREVDVLHGELLVQPDMALRLAGAWGVSGMLLRTTTAMGVPLVVPPQPLPGQPPAPPVVVQRRTVHNPFWLPIYRFAPRVSFHPTYASALYVTRRQGYAVDREEHCVRPPAATATAATATTVNFPVVPQVVSFQPEAGRIALNYRAPAGGFFVVASTFDEGWRAEVDGARRVVYETATGQMATELPPGEHRLVLAYADRLLLPGATLSLMTLAGCALALARRSRIPATCPCAPSSTFTPP